MQSIGVLGAKNGGRRPPMLSPQAGRGFQACGSFRSHRTALRHRLVPQTPSPLPACGERFPSSRRFRKSPTALVRRLCRGRHPDEVENSGGAHMPQRRSTAVVFAASCIASCLAADAAAAQDAVEAFYRGKTVTITVGSAVGGGYDTYARLVARHLGRHIPGNPTIVVQN